MQTLWTRLLILLLLSTLGCTEQEALNHQKEFIDLVEPLKHTDQLDDSTSSTTVGNPPSFKLNHDLVRISQNNQETFELTIGMGFIEGENLNLHEFTLGVYANEKNIVMLDHLESQSGFLLKEEFPVENELIDFEIIVTHQETNQEEDVGFSWDFDIPRSQVVHNIVPKSCTYDYECPDNYFCNNDICQSRFQTITGTRYNQEAINNNSNKKESDLIKPKRIVNITDYIE